MSPAVADASAAGSAATSADSAGRAPLRGAPRSVGGDGLTLEQLLDSVWEGLRADGAAECPRVPRAHASPRSAAPALAAAAAAPSCA